MNRKQLLTLTLVIPFLLILFVFYKNNRFQSLESKRGINSKIDSVIISIDSSIKNKKQADYLSFYYHDTLGQGQPLYFFERGAKFKLSAPTLLLEASDKQLPFLIYPGEKIHIQYAGSDSLKLYIPGNEQRNNELDFFRELVLKTDNIYYAFKSMPYHKKVSTLDSIDILENEINTVKNRRLQMLNISAGQTSLSAQFIKIAANSIESTAFTDSLLLFYSNRTLLTKLNLYKGVILEKTESFKKIDFMPFQIYYKACDAITSLATTGNPYFMINDSREFAERFNFIVKNFTGPLKDFLMTRSMIMTFINVIPLPSGYIQKYNEECNNEGYKKNIAAKLYESKNVIYPKGSNSVQSVDGKTVQDIKTVISKNKGKVILLDFWASWCGPCRQEMPYSKKLKEKLKLKDVAFIYISIDESKFEWLKANEQVGLGNENSFLLLNSGNASFLKQYKINGVPRYLLIGKDGKMISDDAPQPHDFDLEELINKHL